MGIEGIVTVIDFVGVMEANTLTITINTREMVVILLSKRLIEWKGVHKSLMVNYELSLYLEKTIMPYMKAWL